MFGIDDAIGAALKLAGDVVERAIPDPVKAAEAKLQVLALQNSAALADLANLTAMNAAQANIDVTDAASNDFFRGGARPAILWICAAGFLETVLQPWLAPLYWHLFGVALVPLDPDLFMGLMTGMLGLAGYRTYERIKGKIPPTT